MLKEGGVCTRVSLPIYVYIAFMLLSLKCFPHFPREVQQAYEASQVCL